jgi:hypothetical protein
MKFLDERYWSDGILAGSNHRGRLEYYLGGAWRVIPVREAAAVTLDWFPGFLVSRFPSCTVQPVPALEHIAFGGFTLSTCTTRCRLGSLRASPKLIPEEDAMGWAAKQLIQLLFTEVLPPIQP